MAATEIKVQMQQRRDTAADWTSENPVLLSGELGYETDTGYFKIGDGSTAWNSLAYMPESKITSYPLDTNDLGTNSVTSAQIASGAVDTSELANNSVTGDKLADDITIANDLTVTNDLTVNGTTIMLDGVGIGTNSPGDYDSTSNDLVVGVAGMGDRGITIASGTSSRGTVMFADGTSGLGEYAGYLQYNHNGDYLAIATNNSEAVRIDASGNFGIGTSSPSEKLHLNSSDSGGVSLKFTNSTATTGLFVGINASEEAQIYYTENKPIKFATNNTEVARIDASGNFGVGTSTPAVELDVSGTVRASTGVLFGTDTASDNTLDDYEEGTWTPAYSASTTDPTVTYDNQQGSYVRIGKLIHCEGRLRTDAASGGSGNLRISGLPFQAANVANARGGIVPSRTAAWGSNVPTSGRVQHNGSHVELARMTSTSVSANLVASDLDDGLNRNDIHFAITYRAKD